MRIGKVAVYLADQHPSIAVTHPVSDCRERDTAHDADTAKMMSKIVKAQGMKFLWQHGIAAFQAR